MRIIISPAKKMVADPDSLPVRQLPAFLPQAEALLAALRRMDGTERQALWRCSDAIAARENENVRRMDLTRALTPAVLAFDGIQYKTMAPGVMEDGQLSYLEEHLRIVSGFYGLLRPFDGVRPYRLEMQAALGAGESASLYEFWGDRLAAQLFAQTRVLLNLASEEYSRAVLPFVPEGVQVVTCVFGEEQNGRVLQKGTQCKIARGAMVRFLAERGASRAEDARAFCERGYRYDRTRSDDATYVFIKRPQGRQKEE